MNTERFQAITGRYPGFRIAVAGDFCLDRYLEIDPVRAEISIETGLPVHNVVNVRAQPGGAGTVVNNLAALGVRTIFPIGFAGYDGEGFELLSALEKTAGVRMDHFIQTPLRRTFTYCKPLLLTPNKPPLELNRLDLKNWTETPSLVQGQLAAHLQDVARIVDAIIVLDQVEAVDSGVVTRKFLWTLSSVIKAHPKLLVLADSRRGLGRFPPVVFKMNAAELSSLRRSSAGRAPSPGAHDLNLDQIREAAGALAHENSRSVFVTLAENGILGATADGEVQHRPAFPVRGPIDVVGAGDAVSANLVPAMLAGASLGEALELANAAASVVLHKLGATGTASVEEIRELAL